MIIVGYPGVGKSTLVQHKENCIDLESSCFDKSNINWYKDYCNVAIDLHKQGNIVLVSNHELVYKELGSKEELKQSDLVFIFPCLQLGNDWIMKLKERYEKYSTKKNELAYLRARNNYLQDINSLIHFIKENNYRYCCIDSMLYQLDYIVRGLEEGKTGSNIDISNKVCGLCKNFIGGGDFGTCCSKKYDLVYDFTKVCDEYKEHSEETS